MKNIINRIKTDEPTAIEELYQQVKPTSLKIAATYVGQEGLEEDMFHEAFIKAINNMDKYDPERPFQPWFDVILANTCKSYLRKKKTENIQDVTNQESYEENLEEISSIGNPEECWEQKELGDILKSMLEEVSKEQREAIILHYCQGLPVAQIAARQACSENTVKSRLHQGRNKMKAAIEDYEKKQNVKLHSIGVVVAIFVFFKSDMGKAYACENGAAVQSANGGASDRTAREISHGVSEEAAQNLAVETSHGIAAEAAANTASDAVKAVAAEASKTAVMSLGTKVAIGVGAVLLAGMVGAGVWLMNQDEAVDGAATNIIGTELAQGNTESDEVFPTTMPTEAPTATAEPTEAPTAVPTEAPTDERIIPDGITVHAMENGIKKLSADLGKISFSTANGGTVITYTENGCGAIDYDGCSLLENSYKYYYGAPDELGNFMLGDDVSIDIFNHEGEKVHTVKDWYNCYLAEGYVTYSVMDWGSGTLHINCYDITNDKLNTYDISDAGGFLYCGAVIDGQFIAYCWQGEAQMLYAFDTNAEVIDTIDGSTKMLPVYGSPNRGYIYCNYTDMYNNEALCSIDSTEKYPLNFTSGYGYKCNFMENNVTYYNKGKKIVYVSEAGRYYLLDFENYRESAGTEACIVAEYNYIRLSSTGICYAEDDAGNFYMLEDGTRLQDAYIDRSIFADKYAAVLDANGNAYLVDTDMNILTQEEIKAEVVSMRGAMPVAENSTSQTIFLTD